MIKYLPRVRLYTDREKDREILDWLSKMPNGLKTQTIKDAIWASYKGAPPPQEAVPVGSARAPQERTPPKGGTMHGSLTLDTRSLLADIRQIVEAGVAQGLAHQLGVQGVQAEASSAGEVKDLLDDLDMSFILDGDDDEEE